MEKTVKILKINALSLLAIPLLLLATFFKLVAKAFEKITIFLVLGVIALILFAYLNLAMMPKSIGEVFIVIICIFILFAIMFVLVGWLVGLMSVTAVAIRNAIISVLDNLYKTTYNWYLSLFSACEKDYGILSLNGRKGPNAVACVFFMILKGLSWLITTLVTLSYVIGITASVGIVLITLFDLNRNVKTTFGLGLFKYMARCQLHDVIFGILIYVVIIGMIITCIMAMASEWYEWGQELRITGKEIAAEVSSLVKSDLKMATGTSAEVEKNLEYVRKIEDHLATLEPLSEKVTAVLAQKDSALLRSYWGIYMSNLNTLVEECSGKKQRTAAHFKQFIPQIRLLDSQRADAEKLANSMEAELKNPSGTAFFFAGCDTLDKLDKRYKNLCKTYHPDIAEGDVETFKKMQKEYQELRVAFGAYDDNRKA
ncbi:MAG: J domain-containing protein [Lachnospiraceae bacterium]|nr:J domain-containing protein [Lachnospiraceae bacterium]